MRRKRFVNIILIIVSVVIVFSNLYQLGFQLQWDDHWVVINSYTEKGFTVKNVHAVLTTFYKGQYSPVNQFFYMGIYQWFEYDPTFYHIGSLFVHALNCVLLYFLLLRVSHKFNRDNINVSTTALFSTLIFAIHPINLEPVAWLAASKVLIYAFFYLSALHFYITYIHTLKAKHLLISLLLYIISFGAKEQAVVYPLCLVLLDYCYDRDLRSKKLWIEKAIVIVLSLIFGVITLKSQGVSNNLDIYSFYERLIISSYTFMEYLTKCLIPFKLSYAYPFPFLPGELIPLWLFLYPVVLIAIIIGWGRRIIRVKWLFFGISFFTIHVAVFLNLVPLARHSLIADRYAYISLIGPAFVVSFFLLIVMRNTKPETGKGILTTYIICLAFYTMHRLPVWTNSQTLKENVQQIIKKRADYQELQRKHEE